jgi:hypothetical protein
MQFFDCIKTCKLLLHSDENLIRLRSGIIKDRIFKETEVTCFLPAAACNLCRRPAPGRKPL